MQIFKLVSLTAIAAFFVSAATAQTMEEQHKKLTEYHSTITKKSEEMKNGKVVDKKTHVEEMGKNIEGAKKSHSAIMSKMTTEQKTKTKTHNEAIAKHHANATASHKVLLEETVKTNPDASKIKIHSSKISESANGAEKEHVEMTKTLTTK